MTSFSGAFDSPRVAVVRGVRPSYPTAPPFAPADLHPELRSLGFTGVDDSNGVYAAIRQLWRLLEWDAAHFGEPGWNPLGALVRPGDFVLLKPNLICESNFRRKGCWQEVVSNPSVIRAVTDYVLIALQGRGRVVIADGPTTEANWDQLVARTGLAALVDFYRRQGHPVELLDLRRYRWMIEGGVIRERTTLPGDPAGYVNVDLRECSAFVSHRLSTQFYGADYDTEEARSFHRDGRHEYVLCRTPMECDVFINIPKLKTHKKTGVTLSLKNLVGINGLRNCLPHYTAGAPSESGDEFPEGGVRRTLESRGLRAFNRLLVRRGGTGGWWARQIKALGRGVFGDVSKVVRHGNWEGNDTAWRMVLDLNQALIWHDSSGRRVQAPRRVLSVVDGVIGGDGDGPLAPDPHPSGLLVAGCNPWAVDRVAAAEMGFDPALIPLLQRPLDDPERFAWLLASGMPEVVADGARSDAWRPFRPHFGWPSLAGGSPPGVASARR